MEDKNWKDKPHYKCTNCKRVFSTKQTLQQHTKTHLDKSLREAYCCSYCGKKLYSRKGITKHLLICTKNNQNNNSKAQVLQKVKCAMCPYDDTREHMLRHYTQQHSIEISTECIKFNSFDEFEKWKDETEKTTISKYSRYDMRKSATKTYYYYRCHRDGFYKNHGKNIKRLKVAGSNKINGFCPSKLHVTVENENGHVSVQFVKTHVGHQMDLGRIPLGKSEKNVIASKLSLNIPFNEILSSVRSNVDETNTKERLHLLTRKDLYNIERSYNINNSVKHSNDCVSVQAWIKEMQENSCDSVIRFYKGQGEDNNTFSELQKEDFLLIIMNDAQMETLRKYGNNSICIDSTHGLNANGCNFELTTLMVLDDLRQGFPCLFTFTNRSDTVIFKIIFKVLKNVLDFPLTPSVFMSDMTENVYNAWSDVMGRVHFRLFCSWHVLTDWKQNIDSKIKNTDMQSSVHNILRSLLEELDESAFEQKLHNFIHNTETDVELKEFGQYFKNNYYSNRKSWAYCYRKHAGLNTDMHFEQLHRTLKGKTVKRLDKAINAIMTLVRHKLINLHKGKVSTKLSALRKRHENMEQMKEKPVIAEQGGNWILSSATGRELCNIEVANTSCKCEVKCMKCDTCIHGYICSCPDSSVKWNMCKHIHLLCQSRLTNSPPNLLISDDNHLYIDCETIVEETDIAFKQLTSTTVSSKQTNTCRIDEYKEKLYEQFQSVLKQATTMEQCGVISKALASLATTLAAVEPPPLVRFSSCSTPSTKKCGRNIL